MPIKGLNDLTRQLKELQKAAEDLDGDITSVSFDPHDPQSIELAIQKMETAVDGKAGDYRNNYMVESIVLGMKEQYRQAILERAAEARSVDDADA